jgi:DNA-binding PadR family transcriptional regulator
VSDRKPIAEPVEPVALDVRAHGAAEVALLGLLAEEPRHPWEISKEVAEREMRTWTELSQSTIYKQLRALEARGLVQARDEPTSGRIRRVYSVTEAGRLAAAQGVLDLLATPEDLRWQIDIATYNVDLADPTDALNALSRYAQALRQRAEGWARLEDYLRAIGCPSHRWALSRRARHLIAGELQWVDEFAAELRQRAAGGRKPSAP